MKGIADAFQKVSDQLLDDLTTIAREKALADCRTGIEGSRTGTD